MVHQHQRRRHRRHYVCDQSAIDNKYRSLCDNAKALYDRYGECTTTAFSAATQALHAECQKKDQQQRQNAAATTTTTGCDSFCTGQSLSVPQCMDFCAVLQTNSAHAADRWPACHTAWRAQRPRQQRLDAASAACTRHLRMESDMARQAWKWTAAWEGQQQQKQQQQQQQQQDKFDPGAASHHDLLAKTDSDARSYDVFAENDFAQPVNRRAAVDDAFDSDAASYDVFANKDFGHQQQHHHHAVGSHAEVDEPHHQYDDDWLTTSSDDDDGALESSSVQAP